MIIGQFAQAATDAKSNNAQRQDLINSILPKRIAPGIDFLFPIAAGGFDSTLQIACFPKQVTENKVRARIA